MNREERLRSYHARKVRERQKNGITGNNTSNGGANNSANTNAANNSATAANSASANNSATGNGGSSNNAAGGANNSANTNAANNSANNVNCGANDGIRVTCGKSDGIRVTGDVRVYGDNHRDGGRDGNYGVNYGSYDKSGNYNNSYDKTYSNSQNKSSSKSSNNHNGARQRSLLQPSENDDSRFFQEGIKSLIGWKKSPKKKADKNADKKGDNSNERSEKTSVKADEKSSGRGGRNGGSVKKGDGGEKGEEAVRGAYSLTGGQLKEANSASNSATTANTAAANTAARAAANDNSKASKMANNSTAEKKAVDKNEMKRIFAARRRRAQIEMNQNSCGENAGSSSDGGGSNGNARNSNGGRDDGNARNSNDSRDVYGGNGGRGNKGSGAEIKSMRGMNEYTTATPERRRDDFRRRPTTTTTVSNSSTAASAVISSANSNGVNSNTNEKTVRFAPRPQCSPLRVRPTDARYDSRTHDGQRGSASRDAADGVANDKPSGIANNAAHEDEADVAGNDAAEDEAEDVEEEDDVDFLLFVAGLKREVAGDHQELWTGFQSLMGLPTSQHTPLYPFDNDPAHTDPTHTHAADTNVANNGKKKRRIKMDPQTQSSLTLIHKTLANDEKIKKGGIMKTASQLVNDRNVRKEREVRGKREENERKEVVSQNGGGGEEEGGELCVSPVVKSLYGNQLRKVEAVKVIDKQEPNEPTNTVNESTPSETDKKPTWMHSYKKKKTLYLTAYHASKQSPSVSPSSTDSNLKASNSSLRSSTSNTSESFKDKRRKGVVNKVNKMPSWLEVLKKKKKNRALGSEELEQDTTLQPKLRTIQRQAVPDEEVQPVYQLSPRKKPKWTPPSSPEEPMAPWASVKLRSAPKKRESMMDIRIGEHEVEHSGNVGVVEDEDIVNSLSDDNVNVTTKQASNEPLPQLFSIGDVINLSPLPPPFDHESATFSLLSKWANESDPKRIVIVGKSAIVTATQESESQAKILWWSHRTQIQSLTLNVDATGANLALVNGRSFPLSFANAESCLDFAQYFLRGPSHNKPDKPQELDLETSPSTDVSVLTAEEESLLDKFRQYSQSERMKVKLTCLSPTNAEEVEVKMLPGVVQSGNGELTAEEEAVAEKYRKMLKMKVPPEAVRHKMTTEGVDSKIIDAVLNESSNESGPKEETKGLSEEEEAAANKYRKMLKMKVPPEAVRHKMMTEGVDAKIIDAVLNESAPKEEKPETNGLSDEEEAVANKYRKMLKMKVPPEAVRHKMTTEGVDSKIIDAVLSPPAESKLESMLNQLSGPEEIIASKYRKMLKMRVPLDAVKHKMTQDSVDPKIISVIESEAAPDNDEAAAPAPVVSKPKATSDIPVLTEEEEKEASKYRMMIKVCIPKDAIRHDMKKEGVSDRIVEAVLGKEWLDVKDAPQTASKPRDQNRKTIQFHWTTSNLPPELLQQSIFGKADQKKRKIATINPEEADIKKLEELFQKRDNTAATKKKSTGSEDVGGGMAKLLDITRANNIAISLKTFKDFSFRSLAETINDLDPDCSIVGERVQFLPNLLPNPKEIAAIKKFKGEDDKLITAELFFKQLVSIKRIEDKVQVMKTMQFFEDHVEEVREGFKTLQEVCNQVLNSEKLLQVLQMVLNIGNLMNEGTLNGGVDAFKFESLSKLSQTKSADGKTTVLDYIVETFISKGERDVLNLISEFPLIQESSRLSIGDLISEMDSLRKDFNRCKTELTRMKNDQSSKRVTRSMAKKINGESEVDDPRKALFAAIKSRALKEKEEEPTDPRQALFAAIKSRKQSDAPAEDETKESDTEYSRGVKRLQEFLNHSNSVLTLADRDQDAAIRACKGLAVYCGEGGGERAAAPLLQILCEFSTSLESAVKKHDLRVEAEKRAASKAAAKMEKDKENRNKATPTPKRLLKASSFQPHFGITDKVKIRSPLKQENITDAREALFNAIKSNQSKPKRRNAKPEKEMSESKQALLADIKGGKKPSEVKESRILLVSKMLSEASENVKRDFLSGVTYDNTDDPILKKIYEKEGTPESE